MRYTRAQKATFMLKPGSCWIVVRMSCRSEKHMSWLKSPWTRTAEYNSSRREMQRSRITRRIDLGEMGRWFGNNDDAIILGRAGGTSRTM